MHTHTHTHTHMYTHTHNTHTHVHTHTYTRIHAQFYSKHIGKRAEGVKEGGKKFQRWLSKTRTVPSMDSITPREHPVAEVRETGCAVTAIPPAVLTVGNSSPFTGENFPSVER